MSTATTITTDALRQQLAANGVAQFWNVLTDDYFTGEMIPGSRRVPLDRVGREVTHLGLPKDTPIVVYCSGLSCPQSHAAGDKLAALGYTNARVYEGGLEAWKGAGLALETPRAEAAAA